MLEFTATCDLKDPAVLRKYTDKIIFDYALAKFRASGYTKDFQNLQSNLDPWQRTLCALILSEYRRNLFAHCGQDIKPVVLLKSRRIADSESFYETFFEKLNSLSPKEITALESPDNVLLSKAIRYFREKDKTLEALTYALKLDFAKENSIIMNGLRDNTVDKQLIVNSLEEPANPYRIIFTVDMLNEGWDVLNLFDIVRLYETRQSGKGNIATYTIKEAQLIGRGARYCPFVAEPDQERFKRKYDYDLDNNNRILETLLYHSRQDSRYINELRAALKATGLLPENPTEIEYRLKNNFKETIFFKHGLVFVNRRIEKSRENVTQIDKKIQTAIFHVQIAGSGSYLYGLFDDEKVNEGGSRYTRQIKLKDLPLNILYVAMDSFEWLKFNVLKSHYPQLKSRREFLTSPSYVGNVTLVIESDGEHLTADNLFQAAKKALGEIAKHVRNITQEYEGTKEFDAKPIRKVIRNKKIYVDNPHGDGVGVSQTVVVRELAVNLYNEDWYVYEDNFGTTEEKAFVKYFRGLVPELRQNYEEIYLVRNERIPELAIYDFDTGERFEPDFLLFLRKYNHDGYEQEQIFIEPKGDHLISQDKDKWKEDFLLRISKEGIPVKVYVDDNKYRVCGLPFFNVNYRMSEFEQALKSKMR